MTYQEAADALLERYPAVKVVKLRSGMSGHAYPDGTIEAPEPVGAVSFAIFAHEVAHIALNHFHGKLKRWEEETDAWEWALKQFDTYQLPGVERAELRAHRFIAYSYSKAIRRGVLRGTIEERYPSWWAAARPFVTA